MRWSLPFLLLATAASADPATVTDVALRATSSGWTVSVTLLHGDTGWEDYADGWRVEAEGGAVLGTRVLHHPHVDEQPFTRALSGLTIAPEVNETYIRARTNREGWDAARFGPVALPPR